MSMGTALVVIVAIVAFACMRIARYNSRSGRSDAKHVQQQDHDPEARREIDDLRERIKVLEQITVDGREAKAIADEIERLRDR
ncbi:hypothetical protein [Pelagerythrobacter sp.]|uniref:hypothetical protein n=1 Tax=Pelagerythrobacter sp. TaxID=2800702 RepID=UPI0035B305BD